MVRTCGGRVGWSWCEAKPGAPHSRGVKAAYRLSPYRQLQASPARLGQVLLHPCMQAIDIWTESEHTRGPAAGFLSRRCGYYWCDQCYRIEESGRYSREHKRGAESQSRLASTALELGTWFAPLLIFLTHNRQLLFLSSPTRSLFPSPLLVIIQEQPGSFQPSGSRGIPASLSLSLVVVISCRTSADPLPLTFHTLAYDHPQATNQPPF
ncbi:hypothetical protein BDW60DRAFT_98648 [Aspergillus nidulans var. acristatus]